MDIPVGLPEMKADFNDDQRKLGYSEVGYIYIRS